MLGEFSGRDWRSVALGSLGGDPSGQRGQARGALGEWLWETLAGTQAGTHKWAAAGEVGGAWLGETLTGKAGSVVGGIQRKNLGSEVGSVVGGDPDGQGWECGWGNSAKKSGKRGWERGWGQALEARVGSGRRSWWGDVGSVALGDPSGHRWGQARGALEEFFGGRCFEKCLF